MISCDVNVLVYAHNKRDPHHAEYSDWLRTTLNGDRPVGISSLVASGFLRIATSPKILPEPLAIDTALDILDRIRAAPAVVPLEPGRRHWSIFTELCRRVGAKGNTVPDAYFAALAIEQDAEWHTADRGFARFPGLRVRHPLDPEPPGFTPPVQRAR
ncbi:type II toxin-antitoxin system VapC family toxin [Pseudonocardia eucalypti]|uniref:Ribonuclease VapC n=1 Tax=Pseudonocardia eucalypti TaxID=648755 RepID=A0ABP9PSW6_9PSEU|nr:toxin-antitoxin system PIN domain toxin [Pseudonocardia eucalypti]